MRLSITKLILLGFLITAAMLFPADGVRALGLGEARVDSYLGQPLDVTIRLIEADAEALDAMTAASAGAEDYDRLGVPSEALALDLDISIDRSTEPALIRVRSLRSVNDPVIRFLVDARWSSGRVLREYTLFLDPPTVDVAPPSPAQQSEPQRQERLVTERSEPAPQTSRPRPAPPAEPTPAEPPRAREPEPAAETPPEEQLVERPGRAQPAMPDEIEVGAGQTLWGIATDWRPSERLTMNQVMLAIFDRNPSAFDGNVNRLLRGARLSFPDVDDVESLGAAEADRRIRQQMQAWREQMTRTDVPVIAEAAVPEAEPQPSDEREMPVEDDVVHRLDVIPPESDIFDEGPVVSEGEIRRASSRLSELEDEMYADALENDELVRRITSIREAIETREAAGLAVADEELAEFEARLRETRLARESAERLAAEAAEAESATDAEDEIGSYFRQLEEEMADSGPESSDSQDPLAGVADEAAQDAGLQTSAESEAAAMADGAVDDSEVMPDATIGRSSDGSLWTWALVALGAVLAVGGAVAAFVLMRRRDQSEGSAQPDPKASVNAARDRVKADPRNLAAHLGLLTSLADRDDPEEFSAALDDMYRYVDNEDHPQWQEALNLAVVQAPDHPLLTPHETGSDDDDDGLDERTREMLGILPSSDEPETATVEPDDYEFDSDLDSSQAEDDDVFSTEAEQESSPSDLDTVRMTPPTEVDDDDGEIEGHDHDLAELSRRLDRPNDDETASEDSDDDAEDELSFETDDEDRTRTIPTAPVAEERAEDTDDELAPDDPLRLDFEFSDRPTSRGEERDETLPLTDEINLSVGADDASEDDLDIDELGSDLAMDDDELVDLPSGVEATDEEEDLNERGDREVEAFLNQDKESEDEGEPELSDDDAEVKLDLARAYLSMDDPDSARTLLEEITSGGSAAMRAEARKLLDKD